MQNHPQEEFMRKAIEEARNSAQLGQYALGSVIVDGDGNAVDIPVAYLHYFLQDDIYLEENIKKFSSGELLSSEIKKIMSQTIWNVISEHRIKRELVNDDMVKLFFMKRPLKTNTSNTKIKNEILMFEEIKQEFAEIFESVKDKQKFYEDIKLYFKFHKS